MALPVAPSSKPAVLLPVEPPPLKALNSTNSDGDDQQTETAAADGQAALAAGHTAEPAAGHATATAPAASVLHLGGVQTGVGIELHR